MTLKVYRGAIMLRGDQVRACVAASSWAEAARIVDMHDINGCTLSYMRDYWSVTGNPKQIAAAMSRPLVLFVSKSMTSDNYRPFRT